MKFLRRIAFALAFTSLPAHAGMEAPVAPFQLYGSSYYVGLEGVGSVLITSPEGHILIDGGFPESAAYIAANIRTLGFKVEDVKLILNSHTHGDHAGGIAELQRLSGAIVVSSPVSVAALRSGMAGKDDPQFADLSPFPQIGAGYRFSDHNDVVQDFGYSYTVFNRLPCDVLIAAHPGSAELREQAARGTLIGDGGACKRYAAASRENLKARLSKERAAAR